MEENWHKCSKSGDGNSCVRNGKTPDGRQRYRCKVCGKRFLKSYTYKACEESINTNIQSFLKEGVGIRSISRFLGHSSLESTQVYTHLLECEEN